MTKEQEILNFMTSLNISREEAEQLWADDHSGKMTDEQAALEDKAKHMPRQYEKTTAPRKTATRERKIDPLKAELIKVLRNAVNLVADGGLAAIKVNNEHSIDFVYGGANFTVTLTKHK